ncbi:hypothetical protein GCM10009575_075640 [Streptomyces rhizosphaericus]|uniref:Uncharacterized protein n=1 Tax=Streptomyces rhizosphaericus TaxID=114699 RepID=A0ABP4BL94_9ACTN
MVGLQGYPPVVRTVCPRVCDATVVPGAPPPCPRRGSAPDPAPQAPEGLGGGPIRPLRRCWPEGAQSPLSNAGGAGKWGDPPPRATVALSAAQPLPAPLPKCRRGWEAGRSAPLRRR